MTTSAPTLSPTANTLAVTRLTALWAFAEAGLGGLLHALHLPVTGLLVGGAAVLFIALLAHYGGAGAIGRALGVVLLVKLAVSPQSPVGAYVAVAFQGVVGATLFRYVKNFGLAALLLGVLALLESAFQRLLVMALLFGKPLLEAVNGFGKSVAEFFGRKGNVALGEGLVIAYVALHFIWGVAVGLVAGRLPRWLAEAPPMPNVAIATAPADHLPAPAKPKKRPAWVSWLFLAGLVGLVIYLRPGLAGASSVGRALLIVGRAVVILLIWYSWLGPWLLRLVQRLLRRNQSARADDVAEALALLPLLRSLFWQTWQERSSKGIRWFLVTFLHRALTAPTHDLRSDRPDSNR